MYNKIGYNILFTMGIRDDLQVSGVIHYCTSDQDKLDFVTYEIGDNTILLGGSIDIDKVVVLNGDIEKKFFDEIIAQREMEQEYSCIESFLEQNELTFEPLSNYVDSILSSYNYSYGNSLIEKGLEPAVIVENARRMIHNSKNPKTVPQIQYLQRYILPYRYINFKPIKNKDFSIAIYGDDCHVSAVLVEHNKYSGNIPYVFDSTGTLHQKIEDNKTGIYEIDPKKLNPRSRGISCSLNPFGYKFQGEYSSVCGFWSSCFIAEAAKYNKIEDFTKAVEYKGQNIILVKPDFLIKVAAKVIENVDPESITSERPAPEKMKEYGKLGNFYIRKGSKAIKNKNVDWPDKDVDLSELKKYCEDFNKLTERCSERFNTLTQITTSSEIPNLQNKKSSKSISRY